MRRFVLPGLVAAAAVAVLALLTFGVSNQNDTSSIDSLVAHGTFPAAPNAHHGAAAAGPQRQASLADFRGKVVVLNVFASWCDPCQAEAPMLAKEQTMLAKHNATLVGVTYEDHSTASEQFARRYHITYPVLRDVSGNFVRVVRHDRRARDVRDQPPGPDPGAAALSRDHTVAQPDAAAASWRGRREPPPRHPPRARSHRSARRDSHAAATAGADTTARSAATSKASYLQIVNDVMCVVCHEPLAVAQSPEAFQERDYIRQLIAQGKTRKQIENDLVPAVRPRRARPAPGPRRSTCSSTSSRRWCSSCGIAIVAGVHPPALAPARSPAATPPPRRHPPRWTPPTPSVSTRTSGDFLTAATSSPAR